MSRQENDEDILEDFFASARAKTPSPDTDLVARVLKDADAVQNVAHAPGRRQIKRGWLPAIGGWPALAGLATATVAGVTIGLADPVSVGDLAFAGIGSAYDFSGVGETLALGLEDG